MHRIAKKSLAKAAAFFAVVVAISIIVPNFVSASTWTDRTASGSRTWSDVACSSDCSKIVAADNSSSSANLYRSTDGGVTWSALTGAGAKQWKHVASNSDGTHLLASEQSGDVYYSLDSGATWTASGQGTASWTGLCESSDGTVMEAIANGTKVGFFVSTNSGTTWSNPTGLNSLTPNTIACSSDGAKIVVGMFGSDVYTSTNTGTSWTSRTLTGSAFVNGVASSSDGTKLAAVVSFGGDLWTSSNSGVSWTDQTAAGTGGGGLWKAVAISDTGSTVVGVSSVNVRSSSDSGSTWTTETGATPSGWLDVAMSTNGSYWVIGGTATDIWTQGTAPASPPTVTASAASSITTTTATLNGNITSTGNATVTTRGFNYATDAYYTGHSSTYSTVSSTTGTYSTGTYTANISSLTCNTLYHFQAFATNTAGTGTSSDTTFTTSACPVAPTVTTGTSTAITHGTAAVSGNITSTGGENPSSRYIEYGTSSGTYPNQTPTDSGSFSTGAFTEVVRGLTAGTTYFYKACATNTAGTSCGSESSFTTLAAPGAPSSFTATAGYAQVSLSWTAPSAGGYSISDYLVEYRPTGGSTWYVWPHTASTATSQIVTGLLNGTGYDFRVFAVSAAGQGTASSTQSATPSSTPTVPGIPTGLAATTGNGQVSLSWTAPASDGGAAISDYKVEYQTVGASGTGTWTTFSHTASSATSRTVTGLTNGTYYNFRVSATNSNGTGSVSSTASAAAATAIYRHILSTGQSLAEGVNAAPALSTTQPYSNLTLSNNSAQPMPDGGLVTPLQALVETTVGRESPASGMANSLAAAISGNPPFVVTIHAAGGQPYSVIKKGGTGTAYANGQTQASVVKTAVEALGGFYQPFATTIVHGETDMINGTTASAYEADMIQMQSDYESDWNALTGLNQSIPFFETQMNTNSMGSLAVAQLNAAVDDPGKVILVGPKYQLSYNTSDFLHLTNTSSKFMAEMYAKVMKKVVVDGQTWSPLRPVSVTNVGNVVTIDYHIPTGTLAIDAPSSITTGTVDAVAARANDGFEFYQTGGSAISISSVALDSTNKKVVITLSGTPDGTSPHIRYAWTCYAHPNDNTYGTCGDNSNVDYVGGNIRDTDSSTSPSSAGTGLPLYDWGVTFDSAITSPTYPDAPTNLAVTPGNTQAALSWSTPDNDGGSALTDYYIEYKTESASTWTAYSHTPSTSTTATITGLTNGTNYMFRVATVNANGTSAPTNVSTAVPSTTPGTPTSLTPVGGTGQVSLSWTAPASDGGSFITDYTVQYKVHTDVSWTTFSHTASPVASTVVTGLSSGTSYDFQVAAVNANGTGSFSLTATASTNSVAVPDQVTGLTPTAGNTQVALSWTAPAANGSAITDYQVEFEDITTSSGWSTFADGVSTATSATVTGLTNGDQYGFRVSAINGIGTGTASTTATATPATTPGQVTGLTPTRGDTQVALSWTAPASNGGSAVTDYLVEYKLHTDVSWTTFTDGVSTATSATVTGLTNGSSYDFRVSAINGVGTGTASATATATPATTPGQVTGLTPTPGNARMALSWSAPASGGDAITDYLVEYKLHTDVSWTTFADGTSAATSATVTGLTNGSSYDFRVSAINTVGTGTASATATATPVTTPNAPTGLTPSAGNAQVSLTWTGSSDNGGSAITDYLVEYKAHSDSSWTTFVDGVSTSTSATVTGLSNGTNYDFRVSAINGVGTGTASATASATPSTIPGQVTGLTATSGDTLVRLSWTAAPNGGSAITDHLVEYKLSSDSSWSTFSHGASAAASISVTGLTNDQSYDFRVTPINANGSGTVSAVASATPAHVVVVAASGSGYGYHGIVPVSGGNKANEYTNQTTNRTVTGPASDHGGATYISPIDHVTVRSCPAFVGNILPYSARNDKNEVKLWQAFLNSELGTKIPTNGSFGPMTTAATKKFQTLYKSEVLMPGGLRNATGTVYGYTRAKANGLLGC